MHEILSRAYSRDGRKGDKLTDDKWTVKYGEHEIDVTAQMVVDAITMSISVMFKDLATNNPLRCDPKRRAERDIHILIMELVKSKFEMLVAVEMIERHGGVGMVVPKKKPN